MKIVRVGKASAKEKRRRTYNIILDAWAIDIMSNANKPTANTNKSHTLGGSQTAHANSNINAVSRPLKVRERFQAASSCRPRNQINLNLDTDTTLIMHKHKACFSAFERMLNRSILGLLLPFLRLTRGWSRRIRLRTRMPLLIKSLLVEAGLPRGALRSRYRTSRASRRIKGSLTFYGVACERTTCRARAAPTTPWLFILI